MTTHTCNGSCDPTSCPIEYGFAVSAADEALNAALPDLEETEPCTGCATPTFAPPTFFPVRGSDHTRFAGRVYAAGSRFCCSCGPQFHQAF